MDARELAKKKDLARSLMVAGPSMTIGIYIANFAGSANDPAWVWGLFFLFFFGGIVMFIVGAIWLFLLNMEPTK